MLLDLLAEKREMKVLQLLDLLLVALVLVLDELLHQLGGLIPEVVVAHVHLDLAVVDIHDVGTHGVQEVTVVADHDDGAGEVQQEVLQPVDRVNVQVVGGLVHHQQVGVAEQSLGQQHLHLQTGVQGGHVVVVEIGADAKALENAGRVALGLPAAQLGILLFQLAGQHAVLVGHLLLGVQGFLLLADIVETLVAHDDGVHHVIGVVGVLVLLQNRHADVGQDRDLAGGGLQVSGQDLQKGGLAGAVCADDAVAVAPGELEIHMGKQGGPAVLQAQIGNSDHGTLLLFSAPARSGPAPIAKNTRVSYYHTP